jgi:hypothetical protein
VIAYKLVRCRKDGSIGPLFINRQQRITVGEWLPAGDHPTKGFAHRAGWHAAAEPVAPHLSERLANGEVRQWWQVEVADYELHKRPQHQGGTWVLAQRIKFVRPAGGGRTHNTH